MIAAVTSLLLAQTSWPGFRVEEVDMAFKMPVKPKMSQSQLKNATTTLYTSDSPDGRFVAGFIKFATSAWPVMQKQIRTDPGSAAIHGLLEATVAGIAKGGRAKVSDPQFGMDLGLPTEFATLTNDKMVLQIRAYVGSKATYLFITSAKAEPATRFFGSVKLPAEIAKS